MFENIQRTPDVVMIEEQQAVSLAEKDGLFALDDISVETVSSPDALLVYVTAQSAPVKKVRLRWHFANRLNGGGRLAFC